MFGLDVALFLACATSACRFCFCHMLQVVRLAAKIWRACGYVFFVEWFALGFSRLLDAVRLHPLFFVSLFVIL